jgi:D-glycero-alpha-D-manno-heptose 1-phosphate guanylyltransferase
MGIEEAVILCGGLGTRLRSVVADVPKPMAVVAGRPFLEYLLGYLRREGVRTAILSVGYKRDVISDHFGSGWNGMEIRYAVEEAPMGTGGGARLGLALASSEHVLLLNGDSFLPAPLCALADATAEASIAMTVRREEDTERYGLCIFDEDSRLRGFSPGIAGQPGYINAGVYALKRTIFDDVGLPNAPFSFEQQFLASHAIQLGTKVVVQTAPFIDIGVPESFALAQTFIPDLTD